MGKFIEAQYSDIENRVIKKPFKRKAIKKIVSQLQATYGSGKYNTSSQVKRKIDSIADVDEPKSKIMKSQSEGCISEEKSCISTEFVNEDSRYSQVVNSEFCVVRENSENISLTLKQNYTNDLFFNDELQDSYENYINKDFSFHVIDEICLEGLDGITIEAFWKRLLLAFECPVIINNRIKELIWQSICANENIQFYKLPQARGVLDIYDRFQYLDTDIGVVMEMAYELPDIYPFGSINHPIIRGSCTLFDTRADVSIEVRNLTLKDVEQKYGRTLVMVASQILRERALFHESSDPKVEMQNIEYCILERVGRSRKHGELTQGNMSISSYIKMDSRSVFHYRKQLSRNNQLGKQFFYIKSAVTDQNKTGRLLHLNRFFHKIKPKQLLISEQIINIIKTRPNYRLEYSELRKMFPENQQSLAKVIKSPQFHRYVKTDCIYPYRELYPDAETSEYMLKSRLVEKCIRCLELINPYLNPSANWNNEQEDSDEDDDDESEEEVGGGKIYNMECFKEVYYHIHSKGNEGCTSQDVEKLAGLDNKTVRMTLKKLVAKNVVDIKRYDRGRQRHLMYSAKYLKDNEAVGMSKHDEPKSTRGVFSKIKERQRAAREKLGTVEVQQKNSSTRPETSVTFPRIIDIDIPHFNCQFLIRIWDELNNIGDVYEKASFMSLIKKDIIKLNTRSFGTAESFQINDILNNINFIPTQSFNKYLFSHIYVAKSDICYVTKVILLKAALGEVVINNESLACVSGKRKRSEDISCPMLSGHTGKDKTRKTDKKLQVMGDKPLIVFKEQEGGINTEIMVSTPPKEYRYEKLYPQCRDLSDRVMSRIHIVLDNVHEKKVYEGMYKMLKSIHEEEIKEGHEGKIDRKPLARILNKLVKEGYVKVYQVAVCDGNMTKTQSFLCHPSVTHTNSIIQSAYQQLKWKYFVGTHKQALQPYVPSVQKTLEKKIQQSGSPFTQTDVMNSIAEMKEMNKTKFMQLETRYNRYIGRIYGFRPKFIRMRILHEFFFHLIYCSQKDASPLSRDNVISLFNSYRIDVTDMDLKNMPKIYCEELSWKMFIPPLPCHKGWVNGWALVCDIILRLPVSVVCKLHNVSYEVAELIEILNHPIKRFYLIKDLPETIRYAVLFKRKFLFSIHEIMCRLAYCGLLQFGPQKYKEKDQIFIYLNRHASLFDTTTSEPSYHKVAAKEYQMIAFVFNNQADVDNYWYNMYGISLSTKLNAKRAGQLVTLVDVSAKPSLVNAIKSKTPEEAVRDDNGNIPGDKRGAAGLDSSLWAHIIKNWFWANKRRKVGNKPPPSVSGLRKERLEKILPQNLSYSDLHTTSTTGVKVYLHASKSKDAKEIKSRTSKMCRPAPMKTSKSVQRITRKVPSRPKKSEKQYYDHIDKLILKKIGRQMRVKWSENENKMLILCKAVILLLNPKSIKKQSLSYIVIRDVMHRVCPESKNKTSRACQRRIKLLDDHNLEGIVSSLLNITPISKYYSVLINRMLIDNADEAGPLKLKEQELSAAFIILMSHLVHHEEKQIEDILQGNAVSINYLTEDILHGIEKNLVETEECLIKYQDPKDEEDIKKEILKAVIHSSLESKQQPGWAFQLFKIYQKYPDSTIRDAVTDLKKSQAIAFKRFMSRKAKARFHTPFQLSNVYVYSQSTTFDVTTAVEAYKTFLNVKENNKFLDFSQEVLDVKKYGQLIGLNEFCTFWETFNMEFFLPQNAVILNPHFKDHSELIHELAVRWQMSQKRLCQENVDAELEPEIEDNNYRNKRTESDVYTTYRETDPSTSQIDTKQSDHCDPDDIDFTVETGNSETIDRLKTWVTDCMDMKRERRSPSPEFMDGDDSCQMNESNTEDNSICESEQTSVENIKSDKNSSLAAKRPFCREDIPTLEEIKKGMLHSTPPNEKRKIPYITDLSSLLNKENFMELNTDENTLQRLKNHFITQYALLEDIRLGEFEHVKDFYMVQYLQQTMRNKDLWNKLRSEMIIKQTSEMYIYEQIGKAGGNHSDFVLVDLIIAFISEKKALGATAPEIKAHFNHTEGNCSLETILTILTVNGILLRTGICTVTFVHYSFQSIWLIETFVLSSHEQKLLEQETVNVKKDMKEEIDKHLGQKDFIMVKVMPWTKVDGTLNEESLKMWLCNVLSHCLDYPNISFIKLCEKFCYIKPVDIYCLVEILQELGCVEVFTYDTKEINLFSTWDFCKQRCATFLDNFEDMYVAPNNVSMTNIGSFFCDYEE